MYFLKANRKIIIFVVIYSVIALVFHFAALKLIYGMIDLGNYSKELAQGPIKEEIGTQMQTLIRYSENCTSVFLILCYAFLPVIGLLLIVKRTDYLAYLTEILIFGCIQVIGIYLFALLFNKYKLSGTFGRLNIFIHQRFTIMSFIIPSVIYAIEILIKKILIQSHKKE